MRLHLLIVSVAIAAALGACDGGDDDPSTGASSTTTTTSDSSTTASTATISPSTSTPTPTEPVVALPEADASGKSELPDGEHFGYWSTFEVGDETAFGEFDLAYFLTGDEAEAAAAKKGETVENDYYVVNDNPKLRTMIVKGNAQVKVLGDDRGPDLQSANVAAFAVERHKDAGFSITIKEGIVTKIEEQYQP